MANPIFSTLDDVDARDGELIRFQAIQRLYERWGNLKNDFAQSANRGSDRIEKILAKYPQNYIRYHYLGDAGRLNGSTLAVTKGPNYHALQSSKLAFRLGLLSTGVGMVMIATDTILGSTATACSEHVQSYYDADRDNNCKATPVAGPNVLKFLQLEETEQAALLQSYPTLCPIYQKIADTQDFENRQKFGTNEITHSCQDGKALIQLGHDNGLKTEIQLVDLNARMKSHGETIDVTYRKNGEGRVTIAGITWRSSYGGSKPIRYNFPADLEKAGDPRFQNIFQQVAKNTFALESADIFNLDCR
jgi:hypothetical protein